MGYDAIDALTERDYTPDTIDTDTSIFKPGVVNEFIASFKDLEPYSTWETGKLFAWMETQIKMVVAGHRGLGLHDNTVILIDGIDHDWLEVDYSMVQLAVKCLPKGVIAWHDGDQVRVDYTGEYERIGMPGFVMHEREFLRAAAGTYAQAREYFLGYAKSYAGIDED